MTDAETQSAINATAAGIDNISQMALVAGANKKDREFALEQYERDKQLNLENWNRQNDYNSPTSQMQRFRKAGLNPNLIYGQMNNSPTINSTPTRTDVKQRVPEVTANTQFQAMQSFQASMAQTLAQTDNLRVQKELIEQNIELAQLTGLKSQKDVYLKDADLRLKDQKLNQLDSMFGLNLQDMKSKITNRDTQTSISMDSNQRAEKQLINQTRDSITRQIMSKDQLITNGMKREELAERIQLLIKDQDIKKLDQEYAKEGIRRGDNQYYAALAHIADGLVKGMTFEEATKAALVLISKGRLPKK